MKFVGKIIGNVLVVAVCIVVLYLSFMELGIPEAVLWTGRVILAGIIIWKVVTTFIPVAITAGVIWIIVYLVQNGGIK